MQDPSEGATREVAVGDAVGELVVRTTGGFVGPGEFVDVLHVASVVGTAPTRDAAERLARTRAREEATLALLSTGDTFAAVHLDRSLDAHDVDSDQQVDLGRMGTAGSSSTVRPLPAPAPRLLAVLLDDTFVAIS
jgi:hypothetical protein